MTNMVYYFFSDMEKNIELLDLMKNDNIFSILMLKVININIEEGNTLKETNINKLKNLILVLNDQKEYFD